MRILLFLTNVFINPQGSTRRLYVEAVMRGEIEGKFLDDPGAHRDEMMGQVSKLGEYQ